MIGKSLGPYQVVAKLGEGGMGEVYRATDSNLKRSVAIKVLPAAVAGDADRLARFQREAEVLAALNHPNIAAIHGLEKTPEVTALVMELVEGDDLSQRIARGAIPIDEALPIAKQIAEALEAAHEQGIIHRDLKPANIKVRNDGTVKVLDFGLAKALDGSGGSGRSGGSGQNAAHNSPTITSPAMTAAGLILGTAAYMAPEQAKGRAVDKRADIWAFGCVLYEMLTSQRPFDGEDVADVLSRVLQREPAWAALPTNTPSSLRRLLARCLKKDPRARLRDIGEARAQIEELLSGTSEESAASAVSAPPGAASRTTWSRALPWTVAVVFALALVAVLTWRPSAGESTDRPLVRLVVEVGPLASAVSSTSNVIISPDGTRFAWLQDGYPNPPSLFTRRLDQIESTELAGTTAASGPRFSPDGRWIAFSARSAFSKVSVDGGAVVSLGQIGSLAGVSWHDSESILVSEGFARGLLRFPANGGAVEQVAPLPQGKSAIAMASMLPGNKHVLFVSRATAGSDAVDAAIEVLTLEDRKTAVITKVVAASPRYLETGSGIGHLIYNTRSTLFAMPFDPAKLEPRGAAVPIVTDLAYSPTGTGQLDVSRTGTLVYSRVRAATKTTVQWLDPSGKTQPVVSSAAPYQFVTLSPDGGRVALTTTHDGFTSDIWVYDVTRDVMTRATSTGSARGAAWTRDGSRLAVSAFLRGIAQTTPDGSAPPVPLLPALSSLYPGAFTPDGAHFVYVDATSGRKIMTVPVEEQGGQLKAGAPTLVTDDAFAVRPSLSPDARWLAYQSDASGRHEIYVRPFSPGAPSRDRRWQISTDGGEAPRWSRDGRRLVYQQGDQLMAVSYTVSGDTFIPDRPKLWIARLGLPDSSGRFEGAAWDLSPDGTRAIVIRPVADAAASNADRHVVFLQNFFDELRRKAPLPR